MAEVTEAKKPLLARVVKVATEFFWYGSNAVLVGYVIVALIFESSSEHIIILLGFMPKPILLVMIAYLLRGLVLSAYDGRPFTFDNVRRLRLIGLYVLISGPLNMMGKWIQLYLSDAMKHHDHLLLNSVDLLMRLGAVSAGTAIFLGLLMLVLAQVFDMGVRLQTDNDLTV